MPTAPSPHWDFCLICICAGPVDAIIASVNSYLHRPAVPGKSSFLEAIHPPLALTVSVPAFPHRSLSFSGRDMI